MTKRIFSELLIVVVLILIAISFVSGTMGKQRELQSKIDALVGNYDRRANMQEALLIAYPISKYEAQYYAYMFDTQVNECNVLYKVCVPWELFATIAWCESHFQNDVSSPKKAKGVMQILEPTFKGECDALHIKYVENRTIWNLFLNITIGCHYIAQRFKEGQLEGAIRAYVGGPQHAKKDQVMVDDYYNNVIFEYNKLVAIYGGVCKK